MNKLHTLILLAALSGCAFIPLYHRPAMPVEARFANSSVNAGGPLKTIGEIDYKEFFQDDRLQALVRIALKNNRDYRLALLNVAQLQDQYRIVRYALLPGFVINASSKRQREQLSNGAHSNNVNYQLSVNTSYEIDLFGHIRSLKATVLEKYLAEQENVRAAQMSLTAQVAVEYITVCALSEELHLTDQTLDAQAAYLDLIQKSFTLGNASALDLKLAQVQLETLKVTQAGYQRQIAEALDALRLLIAGPLPNDWPTSGLSFKPKILADLPIGLTSDLIEHRPDILAAEHQLKAANANIGAVRATFFPTISLTALDGTASVKLSQLVAGGSQVWSFSPQVSLPLFNQGTNLANLNAAEVSKKIQIAQYEKTIQTAFKEVSDGLAARDSYKQQYNAQDNLVKAQEARYHLTFLRYQNGLDSYVNVLLAQQDFFKAQEALIQVKLDSLMNLILLYKALGGGWKSS